MPFYIYVKHSHHLICLENGKWRMENGKWILSTFSMEWSLRSQTPFSFLLSPFSILHCNPKVYVTKKGATFVDICLPRKKYIFCAYIILKIFLRLKVENFNSFFIVWHTLASPLLYKMRLVNMKVF